MPATPLNSTTVQVDDTDPALVYSGTWVKGGSASEFNVTTHGSTQKGSFVQFIFKGTSIAVYGTIGTDTPTSAYTLDGSTPSVFAAGKSKTFAYQQLFFHSPTLSDANHTLVITNMGSGELWIDYILYTQSSPPASSSSLPLSTTLSLQPTLTSRTLTPTTSRTSSTDTPTPSPPTSSGTNSGAEPPDQVNANSKSSIPAPAAAGGAIGALVLIILLIFGLLYYRKRAKRLAGEKILEKNNVFGDPPESDPVDPVAPITPFTGAYTSSPHPSFSYRNSNMDLYPTSAVYPPSDDGYQNQTQPSTPIYHFSNQHPLRSSYNASSENIAGIGVALGYGGVDHGASQHESLQYVYTDFSDQSDHLQNPHSQCSGAEGHPYASSDRLVVPERRNSLESAESHASLAYLSGQGVAMNPSSSLPDVLPSPPPTRATPQLPEKAGLIVHNPEVRQHEDGGVRLDVQQPHGSGSQQQVVDIPPVYKPSY